VEGPGDLSSALHAMQELTTCSLAKRNAAVSKKEARKAEAHAKRMASEQERLAPRREQESATMEM
jgi:hypothetical protein